jgi:ABC-type multidrug transport system fused ATPase/permease subunit
MPNRHRPFQGRIEFRGVDFAYQDGVDVLRGVSFVAEPGQRIAVVGPSGAGKSTLIGMLLRFYDPRRGQVLIDGQDVRTFTLKSLRDQVTIVLQEAMLFNRSVADNIGFGKRGATREEIVAAATLARADGFITAMRNGYDTVMAEGGDDLSGGQRQRINIARAIIRDTPIVVLDEPLTGLDPRAEAEIGAAIRQLGEGRTTFIVAHRFSTVCDADAILVLDEGTMVGFGTHEQLLATCPRYRELWDHQQPAPAPASFAGGFQPSPQPGGAG